MVDRTPVVVLPERSGGSAETITTAVEAALAAAAAIPTITGEISVFADYADAFAALASLQEGQWVVVRSDENNSYLKTIYRVVSGVLTYQYVLSYKYAANIFDWIPANQHAAIVAGTSAYDCLADFQAAIESVTSNYIGSGSLRAGPALEIPGGLFVFSGHLNIKRNVHIIGHGCGQPVAQGTVLDFPVDSGGLIIHRYNTIDATTQSPTTYGADGTTIRNLDVRGGSGSTDTTKHGIWLRARAFLDNVSTHRFGGNGVNIVATSGSGDPAKEGNANGWLLINCRGTGNGGSGLFIDGADVNAGCSIKFTGDSNGQWGIYDSAFLSNTHIQPLIDGNGVQFKTTIWKAGLVRTTGQFCNPVDHNGFYYTATVGGTAGGSEPTWPTTVGNTVVDGTITWTCSAQYAGGCFRADGNSGSIHFVNPYTENNQNDAAVIPPSRIDGSDGTAQQPKIIVNGDGSGATATAFVSSGAISTIKPVAYGSGYTWATVTIMDTCATSHATATATVSGGQVTGYTVTGGGAGYQDNRPDHLYNGEHSSLFINSRSNSSRRSVLRFCRSADYAWSFEATGDTSNGLGLVWSETNKTYDLQHGSTVYGHVTGALSTGVTCGGASAIGAGHIVHPRGIRLGASLANARLFSNATSAPTTAAVGDVYINRTPAAGGNVGWIGTSQGGTGVAFGNVLLENTGAYDPPSLGTGVMDTIQSMTVTGAALGDLVDVSFSLDLQGVALRAWVSATNTVKYVFHNETAGTVDLASGTVKCRIRK